jgi:hypothetical protein
MEDRNFIVSFNLEIAETLYLRKLIAESFASLGYRTVMLNEEGFIFEKGSKIFTYVGLVNWNYLYRKVKVSILKENKKVILKYSFSWLTNVGVLIKAAMPEIRTLQAKFFAKSFEVERFR